MGRPTINYKNNDEPLDANQNRFVMAIINGSTLSDAILEAYPHTKALSPTARSSKGGKLKRVPKIAEAIEKRSIQLQQACEIEAKWERSDSIKTLRDVIDRNVNELNRINDAFETETDALLDAIDREEDEMAKAALMADYIKQQKTRRISKIHNSAIIESVSELNKMQGYNLTNFEIGSDAVVQFVGEEEIPD